jgi:serine/threonine protein kinase
LHDFGELPAGGAFLVMDLVPGIPWRSHLRGNQPLSPDRVAGWVEGLCEGVAAAHRSGMVHRDLKPENVMIANSAEGETAVILDFGLAKFQPEFEAGSNHGVTVAGMIMGTRPYMSPEQLAGGIVGPPSDVFAIAVMTLETLARFGPPGDGATVEWASRALQRIVKPDSKLIALFASAMLDNPEGRIAPVEEFGRLLVDAIRWEKPLALSITRSDEAETKTLSATEG